MADDVTATEDAPEVVSDDRREALLAIFQEHLGDAVVGSPPQARPGPLDPRGHRRLGGGGRGRPRQGRPAVLRLPVRHRLAAVALRALRGQRGRRAVPAADARSLGGRARATRAATRACRCWRRWPRPAPTDRVLLKADVPDDDPRVPTWIRAYSGAAWHERETHEMFGIGFDGNADLRQHLPAHRVRGAPAPQGVPPAGPGREAVAGDRRRGAHARRRRRGRRRTTERRRARAAGGARRQ